MVLSVAIEQFGDTWAGRIRFPAGSSYPPQVVITGKTEEAVRAEVDQILTKLLVPEASSPARIDLDK